MRKSNNEKTEIPRRTFIKQSAAVALGSAASISIPESGLAGLELNGKIYAEEWAMQNLTGYLKKTFPQTEVFHIPQYCPYTILFDEKGGR